MRAELERHRGREVKTMGDGFLATFDGPARGIRCARAIADQVRAAGHRSCGPACTPASASSSATTSAGWPSTSARGSVRSPSADEVLVSSTVKDLVVGSGISFSDRGARELKGVPGEWRLFAVDQSRGAGQQPARARHARAPRFRARRSLRPLRLTRRHADRQLSRR